MALNNKIYSACYSNVPVYEYNVGPGVHIMRRRAGELIPSMDAGCRRQTLHVQRDLYQVDDWINATHILKAASYDKPARTRILEREVQKGVHEKVQGGYGKYQGAHTMTAFLSRRKVLTDQELGSLFPKVAVSPSAITSWKNSSRSSISSPVTAHLLQHQNMLQLRQIVHGYQDNPLRLVAWPILVTPLNKVRQKRRN